MSKLVKKKWNLDFMTLVKIMIFFLAIGAIMTLIYWPLGFIPVALLFLLVCVEIALFLKKRELADKEVVALLGPLGPLYMVDHYDLTAWIFNALVIVILIEVVRLIYEIGFRDKVIL